MVIGIIGAGISGLVAGSELAKAGHEVRIFEKENKPGGQLASTETESGIKVDYGSGYFTISTPEFEKFVQELIKNDLVAKWTDHFGLYDGVLLHDVNPNKGYKDYYIAPDGMDSISRFLSRWVDIYTNMNVGGLTHIGRNRTKKRSWIINFSDFSVAEVDAIVVATPAVQAYGLLHMTQDETPTKKITRLIDEITYHATYSLMFGYSGKQIPDWHGLEISNDVIAWVTNESSKQRTTEETILVAKSTDSFAKKYKGNDDNSVISTMEDQLQRIFKNDYHFPEWRKLHYWNYDRVKNPLDDYFMELEMDDAPLAIIGNYFKSHTIEAAYMSGLKLAQHWKQKFN